ncbi:hypothetical protein [Actinoplanes campanulatus]|uniref:hypothetical protein n=1 Tax=Actinoplanes campanulatus TaxID=113559 RepID=UPI0019533917|nr:hypothetical protein [Actinoplanes capillaceus]
MLMPVGLRRDAAGVVAVYGRPVRDQQVRAGVHQLRRVHQGQVRHGGVGVQGVEPASQDLGGLMGVRERMLSAELVAADGATSGEMSRRTASAQQPITVGW